MFYRTHFLGLAEMKFNNMLDLTFLPPFQMNRRNMNTEILIFTLWCISGILGDNSTRNKCFRSDTINLYPLISQVRYDLNVPGQI
jgi:hypothetical protein